MNKWFEVKESVIQGKGAFAKKLIPKGTMIIEYKGEVITSKEADERYDDYEMDRHHTFLFAVDEKTVIDGAVNGNEATFINHSCDPNCEPVTEGKQVFIYALRDIPAGEELFYDYGYEREEGDGAEEEAMYKCLCGSKNCRGTILAPEE